MRVVTVVGVRPEYIKAAVVSAAFEGAGVEELILDTGQHYDEAMAASFFDELAIPAPSWSLGVGSGSHGRQTGDMLAGVESVLEQAEPDVVVVYGDTNSTLAGALAAVKMHIPLAHIEAGLRSFNRRMPEEINRVVTDHCSSLLFAPTQLAVDNLAREGIEGDSVELVGDVMFDLVVRADAAIGRSRIVDDLQVEPGGFVLATVHRAENTDVPGRLDAIVDGLAGVAESFDVVWPVHPRTKSMVEGDARLGGVRLIEPTGYVDTQALARHASVVVTDSGGLQKEAFFNGTPCVTLRDETEWVELVDLGWNRLVPPVDAEVIVAEVLAAVGRPGQTAEPYGHGDAGELIATTLQRSCA